MRRIQLAIILSVLANIINSNQSVDSLPGANSACPNEPIIIQILTTKGWSLCCDNEIKFYPLSANTTNLEEIATPKCCGQNPYLPTKSICCGGMITDIAGANRFPGCCNNVLYSRQKFVCCNNQLIELNSTQIGGVYECCYGGGGGGGGYRAATTMGGQLLVDITKELCCSGVVQPIPNVNFANKTEFACCDTQMFRNDMQACCGSTVVNRTLALTQSCCGGDLFDPSLNLCCNSRIQPKNSSSSDPLKCCGTNFFNPKSQKCCADNVVSIAGGENNKCCGSDVYDSQKSTCCNQVSIVPKGKKCP